MTGRLIGCAMIVGSLACSGPAAPAGISSDAAVCRRSLGVAECDGRCADLAFDPDHCGSCGNHCSAGQVCSRGSCAPASEAAAAPEGRDDRHGGLRGGALGTWIPRGPFIGGRLDAIAVSSSSPSTLVVGSPGGGVYRTTNNGASWVRPAGGPGDYSITHFAWDRANPGNLFMTTYNGLYATTDLGDHFTPLVGLGAFPAPLQPGTTGGGRLPATDAYRFAQLVLGATRIVLYAAPCTGLYYSYNGTSYTQSWPFPGGSGNADNCLQSIAADDTTGYVYFSTMGGDAFSPARLYRSAAPWTATTPSLTWSLANTNLPAGETVASITQTSVAGGGVTFPNNLAAAVSHAANSVYQVWTTADGVSWSQTPAQPTSGAWDARVIAYPGSNDLYVGMALGWTSQNYGGTFQAFTTGGDHADFRAFAFSPAFGLMWGVNDGQNAPQTQRNITRWTWSVGAAPTAPTAVSTNGISGWQAYFAEATAAPTASGRRLFTGSQDDELLCSDDQGATWTTAGTPPGGDALAMRYSPVSPSRAFFITNDGDVQYSNNVNAATCAGVTWNRITIGFGNSIPWSHAQMAASPANPNKVYLGGFSSVWAVTVGGGNVQHSTPAQPVALLVDGGGALVFGSQGSGLYRSLDDGVTWSAFGLNAPAPAVVFDLAWSPAGGGAGTYFAATTSGLYRLPPGGAWTLVDGGGGYTVSAVAADPRCPTRIYDGLGFAGVQGQHRGGIRVSSDGGATWTSITSGLDIHQSPVSALQVDPSSSRYVYAASYGLGVWVYDYGAVPSCP